MYGSIEAFQRANVAPDPVYVAGMRTPSMAPLSGRNNDDLGNVHVISKRPQSSTTNNNDSKQQSGVSSPTIWERRRQFRRSVLSSLTRWFPGSKDTDNAEDGTGTQTTRRAHTTVTSSDKGGKPRSNSLMFRRASTSSIQK